MHNVGPTERVARMVVGAAAGAAAMAMPRGWQRTALCSVATSGLVTGLTRYCPINAAMGRTGYEYGYDESVENTEIRQQTQTSAAMGQPPSPAMPLSRDPIVREM